MTTTLEKPQLTTRKVSSSGQLTLSAEARKQHNIKEGTTLVEISLPGCILLLPEERVLADLMKTAQEQLQSIGLSVEKLNEKIKAQHAKLVSDSYMSRGKK